MKNSGVEWIGEIPEDWEVRKILNCLRKRISDGPHETPKYVETGIPFISVDSLNDTEYVDFSFVNRFISDEDYFEYNKKTNLEENDILFSKAATIGKTAIVHADEKFMVWSPIAILKTNNSLDNRFLYFLLNYDGLITHISYLGSINTQINVGMRELEQARIPLPPKETQQHIASYLDKKCSKIEETIQNQQRVIEKLKAYKQSLITEAVTGKVKIVNGKACGEYESYKDFKLKWLGDFNIPEKWNRIQVKSFVSIPVVDGPHESPELFDNGIPYISATAIENSKIDFSLKRGFISEKYCNECDKRYKPMRDDKLMIKLGATTGQVAIVETDERFNIWVPLAAIRCNKNIALPKFVFYSFQSDYCLKQMEMSWTFGTQQTLGVSSIERLKIFLPNIETQKEIAGYLDKKCTAIDTVIEQKQKLIEKLTEYKKSLIYECVTGKKEI